MDTIRNSTVPAAGVVGAGVVVGAAESIHVMIWGSVYVGRDLLLRVLFSCDFMKLAYLSNKTFG